MLTLALLFTTWVTIYILIYVDDLIITDSDETLLHIVVTFLSKIFSLKYLGLLHYFLGIEVHKDADEMSCFLVNPSIYKRF